MKKEHTYIWEGVDSRGFKEKGEITAPSVVVAKVQLREKGIKINKIKKASKFSLSTIRNTDVSLFTRQLAVMIKANIQPLTAFEIIAGGHKNRQMRRVVYDVKNRVESGETLKEAFSAHPKQFNDLYVNLIDVGETGGFLDRSLLGLSLYLEKADSLRRKVKKALTYPAIVITVAILVVSIILIYVIPTMKGIFDAANAPLPDLTLMVLSLSDFFIYKWHYMLFMLLIYTSIFYVTYKKNYKFRKLIHKLKLKTPILGKIFKKSITVRWARTFAAMYAAGVGIEQTLSLVAKVSDNIVYEEATDTIKRRVMSGVPLDVAIQECGVFSELLIQMVKIGYEAGSLDDVLNKVADIKEEEVDIMVDNLSTLIEPIMIIVLGVIIGTIVIAMYLPIFKLAGTI